ncbi:hypothetical protein B5807_10258 [Epicoccum nigrum]|uniref:F-box domain-containing protein n=1 Tax=Epicoccum nigrum TaxID=105696 RepID=A0A1Y2LQT5_EPING|nr:hypothetical protein B5807_10258 [Epicoccum nigrum]
MPLEQLPAELLLQIALHLPDSSTPSHLKNLSLASRALRPIAQEALFTTAKLCICCGCHPKINALIKLLRTTLERPDLACKVKSLRFRAVRKPVDKLYTEQGLDLADLRDRCILKLEELGFQQTHPWWRSINNSIESSFGGLLLALLPQLTEIDFWVKDHQRGPPSSECISGLWGGTSPPKSVLHNWKNVNRLITGDTSMLKCGIHFKSLSALDLRTISIGTVLRLNGPGSLQGAENITDLALTASIQFADKDLIEKAEIEFGGLLEALACRVLKSLKISLINDGYNIDDALIPEFNGGYFLSQLYTVQDTLESLAIKIETTDNNEELEWMLEMFHPPNWSPVDFPTLKSLTIPEVFLFTSSMPYSWDMPPKLEQLDLLWPSEVVENWIQGFIGPTQPLPLPKPQTEQLKKLPRSFQKLILTCLDDVGVEAAYFADDVSDIFCVLWGTCNVVTEIYDQARNTREILHLQYKHDDDSEDDHSEDNDGEVKDDDDNSDKRATIILALLKQRFNLDPNGLTVAQLAAELRFDLQQVQKTVEGLHRAGRILAPTGLGEGSRVQFVNTTANMLYLGLMIQGHLPRTSHGGTSVDEQPGEHACIDNFPKGAGSDGALEDDDGTDEEMPDLEPVVSVLAGPRVAPLSRVGLITETAVLRFVRQCGPLNHLGVTYQDIATSLGTDYDEIATRMDSLCRAGYVRAADDKAYFVSENDELLREDLGHSIY